MRLVIVLFLALLMSVPLFTGCREAKKDMEEYGDALMTLPDRARVLTDLTRIRQALELYKVEHEGSYPESISELNLEKLYYEDEYEYDSSTGKVMSTDYPTM